MGFFAAVGGDGTVWRKQLGCWWCLRPSGPRIDLFVVAGEGVDVRVVQRERGG